MTTTAGMMRRARPLPLMLAGALLAACCAAAAAESEGAAVASLIKGKITTSTDVFNMAPVVSGASAAVEVTLTSRDGRRVARTFVDRDGWFAFADVPLDTSASKQKRPAASSPSDADADASADAATTTTPTDYLLSVSHPDYLYPDVALRVAPKGVVRAMFAQNRAPIPASPYLVVPPVSALDYYERRRPLDVWGMVKSPYGLMVVFMLFSIFVMPMLKVDPEEYAEAMASLRGGGGGEGEEAGAGGGAARAIAQGGGGGGAVQQQQQQPQRRPAPQRARRD